jgi:ATP-dependent helicase HrpB
LRPALPIDDALPRIVESLRGTRNLVLRAPPGAGKTTRVPPAVLDVVPAGQRVVMLEPRRVAARAAARRIALERGASLGGEVGYQIRYEDRTSRDTRIVVVTEGLLTRRLVSDPMLEDAGAVLLDEFHERSLHADLALAFLREIQETVRPDLKIVVMSATLETGPVAAFLDAPVIEVEGRAHPVDIRWLDAPDDRPPLQRVPGAVRRALAEGAGDLLVFLPGAPEIRRTMAKLEESLAGEVDVVPLYGDLSAEDQDRALQPGARRKVILATNIAETSLTIEGVTTVIDAGLAKVLRHDPARGMDRLDLVRISRASATQRAGRAGRTGPGRAFRLWTRTEDTGLAAADVPEIARVDLAPAVLELLGFAARDPAEFRWFEPPPASSLERAVGLLRSLGALDSGGWQLTALGKRMRAFPLHPRLSACLVAAHARGVLEEGALATALCAERDILRRGRASGGRARFGASDVLARAALFEELERARFDWDRADALGADAEAARSVARARDRLTDMGRRILGKSPAPREHIEEAVRRALLAGFSDRVARRRVAGGDRVVLVGGRGARVAPESVVAGAELMIAIEVEDTQAPQRGLDAPAGTESLVRQASAIEEDWLETEESLVVRFDSSRSAVECVRERRYRDLVLSSKPAEADAERVAETLADAAARDPERALPLSGDAEALLARIAFARRARPDAALPDLTGQGLARVLKTLCYGCRSFADLKRADLTAAIRGDLGHARMTELDRLAPAHLTVPSGSAIKLRYEADGPVLSVRLQECFGLQDTPRVAGVAVKLELLGPNFRPVQITQDLASFWDRTYPEVRKDMRARYPKHSWPENPREAQAVRGPRKRR